MSPARSEERRARLTYDSINLRVNIREEIEEFREDDKEYYEEWFYHKLVRMPPILYKQNCHLYASFLFFFIYRGMDCGTITTLRRAATSPFVSHSV